VFPPEQAARTGGKLKNLHHGDTENSKKERVAEEFHIILHMGISEISWKESHLLLEDAGPMASVSVMTLDSSA
jgi:hypothetical protein